MQNPKSPKNKNKPTRQNTTCQRQEKKKFKKLLILKGKTHPAAIQILVLKLVVKNLVPLHT